MALLGKNQPGPGEMIQSYRGGDYTIEYPDIRTWDGTRKQRGTCIRRRI